MARQTAAAITLVLAAALALAGCGRKGPLDPPGAPADAAKEAPAGTPTPAAKPDHVDHPPGAPEPAPKPDSAKSP